jgi:hypothetical protein
VGRKLIVVVLGALAALALVARRRHARVAVPAQPESNGAAGGDSRESLRRFVEAGERLHGEQPSAGF